MLTTTTANLHLLKMETFIAGPVTFLFLAMSKHRQLDILAIFSEVNNQTNMNKKYQKNRAAKIKYIKNLRGRITILYQCCQNDNLYVKEYNAQILSLLSSVL